MDDLIDNFLFADILGVFVIETKFYQKHFFGRCLDSHSQIHGRLWFALALFLFYFIQINACLVIKQNPLAAFRLEAISD